MRSNSAITVQVADGLVEGDMSDEKAVPLEAGYGLNLAMFRMVLGPPTTRQAGRPRYHFRGWYRKELARKPLK